MDMGALLPWWILIAPAVCVLVDAFVAPRTSSMSRSPG